MRGSEQDEKKNNDGRRYSLNITEKYGITPKVPPFQRIRHDHEGVQVVIRNGKVQNEEKLMERSYFANLVEAKRYVEGNLVTEKVQIIDSLNRFVLYHYDDARITVNDFKLVMSNTEIFCRLMYQLNDKKIKSFTDEYVKRRVDELREIGLPKSSSKEQLDLSRSSSKNKVALPKSSSKEQSGLPLSASEEIRRMEAKETILKEIANKERLQYENTIGSVRHTR